MFLFHKKEYNKIDQFYTTTKHYMGYICFILFYFFINMSIRVSLHVSRLILWALKLTTM